MTQQAALESEVADSMHGFARQRARIEEDISRRQELAAVAATTAAGGGRASSAAAAAAGSSSGRVLQHMDSQHQPSQVTAELGLTAGGKMAGRFSAGNAAGSNDGSSGSSGVQLVVPDKVKAARKQHQQGGGAGGFCIAGKHGVAGFCAGACAAAAARHSVHVCACAAAQVHSACEGSEEEEKERERGEGQQRKEEGCKSWGQQGWEGCQVVTPTPFPLFTA
jgi:hypothetical protein